MVHTRARFTRIFFERQRESRSIIDVLDFPIGGCREVERKYLANLRFEEKPTVDNQLATSDRQQETRHRIQLRSRVLDRRR